MSEKAREFWINERTGAASCAEESIENGYHTHVIEKSAYDRLAEINKVLSDALEGLLNKVNKATAYYRHSGEFNAHLEELSVRQIEVEQKFEKAKEMGKSLD